MFNLLGRLIQRVESDWQPAYQSSSFPSGDLTRQLDLPDVPPNGDVRVKVVGIGGARGNAVRRMASAGLRRVDFLAVNTDVQACDVLRAFPHSP